MNKITNAKNLDRYTQNTMNKKYLIQVYSTDLLRKIDINATEIEVNEIVWGYKHIVYRYELNKKITLTTTHLVIITEDV